MNELPVEILVSILRGCAAGGAEPCKKCPLNGRRNCVAIVQTTAAEIIVKQRLINTELHDGLRAIMEELGSRAAKPPRIPQKGA